MFGKENYTSLTLRTNGGDSAAAVAKDITENAKLKAVPETEYPLALRTYLGDDGLTGAGISLYRAFGGLGTHCCRRAAL